MKERKVLRKKQSRILFHKVLHLKCRDGLECNNLREKEGQVGNFAWGGEKLKYIHRLKIWSLGREVKNTGEMGRMMDACLEEMIGFGIKSTSRKGEEYFSLRLEIWKFEGGREEVHDWEGLNFCYLLNIQAWRLKFMQAENINLCCPFKRKF